MRERFGELIDVIYDTSKECEDSDNTPIIHDSNDCNSDYDECITDAKSYHMVEISELHTPTDLVGDTLRSQVEVMAMNAYSNLLQEYISLLIKARCLKPAERAKNDKDYINFLNRNDFDLLFGARWFFMASDFDSAEEFNKKIEKYTQIIANGYSKGFRSALIRKEKLHFYIRNLKVKINDERPYNYRALGDIELPFEKEELRVFIANERKVITVQAEIRVEPGKASGAYIE